MNNTKIKVNILELQNYYSIIFKFFNLKIGVITQFVGIIGSPNLWCEGFSLNNNELLVIYHSEEVFNSIIKNNLGTDVDHKINHVVIHNPNIINKNPKSKIIPQKLSNVDFKYDLYLSDIFNGENPDDVDIINNVLIQLGQPKNKYVYISEKKLAIISIMLLQHSLKHKNIDYIELWFSSILKKFKDKDKKQSLKELVIYLYHKYNNYKELL